MIIAIHGFLQGSNFGDIIYAYQFYKELKKLGHKVYLLDTPGYNVSDFCKNTLNCAESKNLLWCLNNVDAVILISGGSLGEKNNSDKEATIRYEHFIFPMRLFQLHKIPTYVIGVGGGPLSKELTYNNTIELLNESKLNIFRDLETYNYFKDAVKQKIDYTTDTILALDEELPKFEFEDEYNKKFENKKKLLFHINSFKNKNLNKIINSLNTFLNEHKDYEIIVTLDNLMNSDVDKSVLNKLIKYTYYNYHDVWQLCSLIKYCDTIVTTKLHVGVIGCLYNKSVISFATHPYKTVRFYRQINEEKRTILLSKSDESDLTILLNTYHNKNVKIDDSLIKLSKSNLDILKTI